MSPVAHAVIIAGPNGQGNAEESSLKAWAEENEKPTFSYWDNVVRVSDASGIYLGASGDTGWVMTAAHVTGLAVDSPFSTITVAGNAYQVHENVKLAGVDLRMYRIGGEAGDPALPDLETVPLHTAKPDAGSLVLMFGAGGRVESTAGAADDSDIAAGPGVVTTRFEAAGAGVLRWGTNYTEPLSMYPGYDSFFTKFDMSDNYLTSTEAALSLGDSGGPVFVAENGGWALAGINAFVRGSATQAAFGDYSGFVSVAAYEGSISANFVPEPSGAVLLLGGSLPLLMRRRRRLAAGSGVGGRC